MKHSTWILTSGIGIGLLIAFAGMVPPEFVIVIAIACTAWAMIEGLLSLLPARDEARA